MIKSKQLILLAWALVLLSGSNIAKAKTETEQVSIAALATKSYSAELNFQTKRYQREKYNGTLMSYVADDLKLYTLVNTPTSVAPENGFPAIIFGHGFHPEPSQYGISKDGETSRPGDYYRGLPSAYAERGFVVLSPDYRGHNISAGTDFVSSGFLATSYYASDVLHLLAALRTLDGVDLDRIFFVGHSMGGEVGLKTLLATNLIKAASLWAPVSGTTYQQAFFYRDKERSKVSSGDQSELGITPNVVDEMNAEIDNIYANLVGNVTPAQVDPITNLSQLSTPLVIHHAVGDKSVPYLWSENLVIALHALGKQFTFYAYDSDKHLFAKKNRELAIERDINYFLQFSNP